MKFTNFPAYSFILLSFLLLIIAGCNDGGNGNNNGNIAVDSIKVQQHIIPIRQAIEYTTRFRENRARLDSFFTSVSSTQINRKPQDSLAFDATKNPFRLLNAEYFNRDAIAALLNQAGSDGGIRIYLGQDEKGVVKLVLIPAKINEDIITKLGGRKALNVPRSQSDDDDEGDAIEKGQECPEMCPRSSPLN